jgi:hypothetical protein
MNIDRENRQNGNEKGSQEGSEEGSEKSTGEEKVVRRPTQ